MTLTLLIDLDDTLLGNSMETFLPAYLQSLAGRMAIHADPARLVRTLLAATNKMIANERPDCTLEEIFSVAFFPALGLPRDDVQETIDSFYEEDFSKLRELTQYRPEAVQLVQGAIERGYRVGIATNPLFPRTAIVQRLSWAGLPVEDFPFSLIPSYESFHFAKPKPAYYAEFLAQMGWPEGPVVMVGNEINNDIDAALQLGLPVYWVNEGDTNSWVGPGPVPPGGSLDGVLPWLDGVSARMIEPDYKTPKAMLAILRAIPAGVHSLCSNLEARKWKQRPNSEEWSPIEILCHLRDVEVEVNLPRLHKVLAGDNPFIPGQDTDPWAEERQYIRQDGIQALYKFTAARWETLTLLSEVEPLDWDLPARHAIFGPTNLKELVSIIGAHDRLHIRQLYQALHG